MPSLLVEFDPFPEEKALVGEMLMAYGEIEFALVRLISVAFQDDTSIAVRILFRVKGEGPRLDVADGILRPALGKIGLGGLWGNAIGAAKCCKDIRNQYAHCHWWHKEGDPLSFINLDTHAASREGDVMIQFEPVDLTLIKKQHQFFEYTTLLLYFLDQEYRRKAGLPSTLDLKAPVSVPQPPKSNLKDLLARRSGGETT